MEPKRGDAGGAKKPATEERKAGKEKKKRLIFQRAKRMRAESAAGERMMEND